MSSWRSPIFAIIICDARWLCKSSHSPRSGQNRLNICDGICQKLHMAYVECRLTSAWLLVGYRGGFLSPSSHGCEKFQVIRRSLRVFKCSYACNNRFHAVCRLTEHVSDIAKLFYRFFEVQRLHDVDTKGLHDKGNVWPPTVQAHGMVAEACSICANSGRPLGRSSCCPTHTFYVQLIQIWRIQLVLFSGVQH